jgi:hypothetical protein
MSIPDRASSVPEFTSTELSGAPAHAHCCSINLEQIASPLIIGIGGFASITHAVPQSGGITPPKRLASPLAAQLLAVNQSEFEVPCQSITLPQLNVHVAIAELPIAKKQRRAKMDTIFLDIMFPPNHLKQTTFTYETMDAWRTPPDAIH